jgi:hypothetical protein
LKIILQATTHNNKSADWLAKNYVVARMSLSPTKQPSNN